MCARNLLGDDDEQDSARYMSCIFLLLRANPEIETSMDDMNLVSNLASLNISEA